MRREKRYEEYAWVLDFIVRGTPRSKSRIRGRPFAQVIGENFFTLLEVSVREGVILSVFERVFVGKDNREKIDHILGRIGYKDLTFSAKVELPRVIEYIILHREREFVDFFNKAHPITPRMHSLELLPGIGKKYMWAIINEREKKPFESLKDVQERTGIPSPVKLLAKRIIEELMGESKYYLFVRMP